MSNMLKESVLKVGAFLHKHFDDIVKPLVFVFGITGILFAMIGHYGKMGFDWKWFVFFEMPIYLFCGWALYKVYRMLQDMHKCNKEPSESVNNDVHLFEQPLLHDLNTDTYLPYNPLDLTHNFIETFRFSGNDELAFDWDYSKLTDEQIELIQTTIADDVDNEWLNEVLNENDFRISDEARCKLADEVVDCIRKYYIKR